MILGRRINRMSKDLIAQWRIAVWKARADGFGMEDFGQWEAFFELWYGCLIDEGK